MARSRLVHALLPSFLAAAGLLAGADAAPAQELQIKRDVPDLGPFRCAAAGEPRASSGDERTQADRLGSSASQALILGDTERARDLLARATELDPASAELAYQHGRILEDLGEFEGAVAEYCRVLALAPESPEALEVRPRLDALTASRRPTIAPAAVVSFETALAHYDRGRLPNALEAFRAAAATAPAWPEPVYDEAVVLLALGRREEAAEALGRYLELAPGAPDAIRVSQRIGQLRTPVSLPSPGAAFTLGLVVPGMGQFYSGRPLGGFMVMALAGGAAATGFLIEEITVLCADPVPPGEDCPQGRVHDEIVEQPYKTAGLAAAGAVMIVGAIEALVHARGRRRGVDPALLSLDLGAARLGGPAVVAAAGGVELRWLRLTF